MYRSNLQWRCQSIPPVISFLAIKWNSCAVIKDPYNFIIQLRTAIKERPFACIARHFQQQAGIPTLHHSGHVCLFGRTVSAKATVVEALKVYDGSGGTVYSPLALARNKVIDYLHAPASLPPGINPSTHSERRCLGPHSWSGRLEKRNYSLCQDLNPG